MTSAEWALVGAVFVAGFVEMVEAMTIVLAMGKTRGWRSAIAGAVAAVLVLIVFTAIVGYSLSEWLHPSALQIVIGTLLLIFGLQWLRKAILRYAGLKAMHDEEAEFAAQAEAARRAKRDNRFGIDMFGFAISFKGVFLEGVEVVFIVITFGLAAQNMPLAIAGAASGAAVVALAAGVVARPLSNVPENTLKYWVGLLLAAFGTYWAMEGLGIFLADRESLNWPGSTLAIGVLIAVWFLLSRILITTLPRATRPQITEPVHS